MQSPQFEWHRVATAILQLTLALVNEVFYFTLVLQTLETCRGLITQGPRSVRFGLPGRGTLSRHRNVRQSCLDRLGHMSNRRSWGRSWSRRRTVVFRLEPGRALQKLDDGVLAD